ncbi:MAG: hypothetical protein HRU06_21445 [Oceanospirillaceae bacterium]|nr:hypothetical protein [Oceanospirillaceae bacterium]
MSFRLKKLVRFNYLMTNIWFKQFTWRELTIDYRLSTIDYRLSTIDYRLTQFQR